MSYNVRCQVKGPHFHKLLAFCVRFIITVKQCRVLYSQPCVCMCVLCSNNFRSVTRERTFVFSSENLKIVHQLAIENDFKVKQFVPAPLSVVTVNIRIFRVFVKWKFRPGIALNGRVLVCFNNVAVLICSRSLLPRPSPLFRRPTLKKNNKK